MTIMTGVKSPWILGQYKSAEREREVKEVIEDELGIEIIN